MGQAIYTAVATARGDGRNGEVTSSDGVIDESLAIPKEMGGPGGDKTNPEQLFAAGYSAWFHSALQLIAKQAHWNVVGPNFRSAHLQLDELVDTARQYVDQVAERANAIGVSPNGKAKTVVESSGVPEYPDNWQSVESTVAAIVDI